jgi:hypothetical protein
MVDMDALMGKLLLGARRLVGAEAGTVYLAEADTLTFVTSQNDYLQRSITPDEDLPFLHSNLPIDHGTLAGHCALERRVLAVDDTFDIDPSEPYQHDRSVDSSTSYDCKAVISLPLAIRERELLGVLQIINPLDEAGRVAGFSAEDVEVLTYFAASASMALEKAIMLRKSFLLTVGMVSIQEPAESTQHAQRVALAAREIYSHWSARTRVPADDREHILNILPLAAMLHDVGKSWLPRELLTKPGRLDPLERGLMEGHVMAGARLFRRPRTSLGRLILTIILDHHERWDGRGYPGPVDDAPAMDDVILGTAPARAARLLGPTPGKRGEAISIYGRIMAVADVYDALSSRKSYKEAFDESLVCQIMEQESGHHFDPSVIESFMAVQPALAKIRERYPEVEEPYGPAMAPRTLAGPGL